MHFPSPNPVLGGFGFFGGIFADVLAGLVFIICFAVVVGVLVVLVRFLLVATRAAELYIARNSAKTTTTATTTEPAATRSTATSPTASRTTTTRPAPKATKPDAK
jgi:cytoskeletal protein RodZ